MADKLTTLFVENAKPEATRREIPDGETAGLFLVVQPTGVKSWAYRYRFEGRTRKHTLGKRHSFAPLKEARLLAKEAAVKVGRGIDPAVEASAEKKAAAPVVVKDLIETVVETFIERHAKKNTKETSWRETKRILDREVVSVWAGRRLSQISRADVQDLLDGIVDRGAPVQANRTLAAVRKMAGWAVERGLTETNPCEKVKAPASERSRDRVLTDDELRRVLTAIEALGQPFGPLLQILALTGQRRDEAAQMRWSELDLDARLWTLPRERSKNGNQHAVPLSEPAVGLLASLPRIGAYVFTTNGKTPVSGFSKAKAQIDRALGADMPAWVFHDLRRTMVSGMAALGIALPVIEKVVNHTSGSFGGIVGVYQRHSFDKEKRHALEAWASHVGKLLA